MVWCKGWWGENVKFLKAVMKRVFEQDMQGEVKLELATFSMLDKKAWLVLKRPFQESCVVDFVVVNKNSSSYHVPKFKTPCKTRTGVCKRDTLWFLARCWKIKGWKETRAFSELKVLWRKRIDAQGMHFSCWLKTGILFPFKNFSDLRWPEDKLAHAHSPGSKAKLPSNHVLISWKQMSTSRLRSGHTGMKISRWLEGINGSANSAKCIRHL